MRDHPAHVAYMMGGTWGAKVDKERANFFASFKKLFQVISGNRQFVLMLSKGWTQMWCCRNAFPLSGIMTES